LHDPIQPHERSLGGTATRIEIDGGTLERHDRTDGSEAVIEAANRLFEIRITRSRKGTSAFEIVLGNWDRLLGNRGVVFTRCLERPSEPKQGAGTGLVSSGMLGLQFQKVSKSRLGLFGSIGIQVHESTKELDAMQVRLERTRSFEVMQRRGKIAVPSMKLRSHESVSRIRWIRRNGLVGIRDSQIEVTVRSRPHGQQAQEGHVSKEKEKGRFRPRHGWP
jgi:hypothetical protein